MPTSLVNLLGGTVCLFRATTGIPCPMCGMTRAITALLRGDLAEALLFHPLLLPLIALLLLWFFLCRVGKIKKAALPLFYTAVTLLITVYIVRMFMFFPHTEPLDINTDGVIPRIFGRFT